MKSIIPVKNQMPKKGCHRIKADYVTSSSFYYGRSAPGNTSTTITVLSLTVCIATSGLIAGSQESEIALVMASMVLYLPLCTSHILISGLVLCQEKVQVKHELFTSIICLMPHLFPFVLVLSNISFRSH